MSTGIQITVDPRSAQQGSTAINQALNNIRNTVNQLASDMGALASATTQDYEQMGDASQEASNKMVAGSKEAESAADSLKDAYEQLKGGIEALGALEIAKQFLDEADAATKIQNQLRGAIGSTVELNTATADLYKVAQTTRSSLAATVDLYDHLAQATRDLGLSEKETAALTQTISEAIQSGGASAEEATGATEGFVRALTLGRVEGREFLAILSGSPKLAADLADAYGVHIDKLKQLAAEGSLTASSLVTALQKASPAIAAEFAKIEPTVGGALTQLKNYFDTLLESMDKFTGSSKAVKDAINTISGGPNAPQKNTETIQNYQRITGNTPGGQSLIQGFINEVTGYFKENQSNTQQGLKDRETNLALQRDPSSFPYFTPSQPLTEKLTEFDMSELDARKQTVAPGLSQDDLIAFRQLLLNIEDEQRTQKDLGLASKNQETLREQGPQPLGAQSKRVEAVDKSDLGAVSDENIKKIQADIMTTSNDTSTFLKSLEDNTQHAVNVLHNQFEGFFEFAEKSFTDLSNIQGTFLTDFTTGLADSLATGKFNFGQFAQYLLQQLLQIELRAIIVRGILGLFGGSFSSLGSAGAAGAGVQAGAATGDSLAGSVTQYAAAGTDYAKGGWTMTGEEGPELLNMNPGAQVMNASDTRAALRKKANNLDMGANNQSAPNMQVSVGSPNITISTQGVTQNDVRKAVSSGVQEAITQSVSSVQNKYRKGKL